MMLQKHHTLGALAGLAAFYLLQSQAVAQLPDALGGQGDRTTGESLAFTALPSLMFSETEMNNLQRVTVALRGRSDQTATAAVPDVNQDALLDEIFANAQEKNPEIRRLPNFYLSSVLYRSQRDWKVWVRVRQGAGSRTVTSKPAASLPADRPGAGGIRNALANAVTGQTQPAAQETDVVIPAINQRISLSANKPENNQFGLRVVRISDDDVTLAYAPEDLQFALMHYKKGDVVNVDGHIYRSRLVKGGAIHFDAEAQEFTTRLRSNQSFSMDLLKIVEGQYFPSDVPHAPSPKQVADADKSGEKSANAPPEDQPEVESASPHKVLELLDSQRGLLQLLQQNRSDQ